jgi:hypothetical protein
VARNHNTTQETLERLSNDDSIAIREMVAMNHNTSHTTLDKMSNTFRFNDYLGHVYIIQNPNTTKYTKTHIRYQRYLNLL